MDALFNVFGFGMQKPDDKWKFFENQKNKNIEEQEKKRGIFWANRDMNKPKKAKSDFDISSMGGTGPLDQTGKQILPSQTNYPGNINKAQQQATYQDQIMKGGSGINEQNTEQLGFLQKLSNMANVDFDKAAAHWKDKGGFEGLMSNPAFTMGLAFMQAGAEGKTLGSGALDNVMKAAGISSHYKRLMEAKAGGVTELLQDKWIKLKAFLEQKEYQLQYLEKCYLVIKAKCMNKQ